MDGIGTAADSAVEQSVENGENGAVLEETAPAEQNPGAEKPAESDTAQENSDQKPEGQKKAAGEKASEKNQKAEEKSVENPDAEAKLTEREKSLQEREAALQQKEIEDAAKDLLKKNHLPVEKAMSIVQASTKEETQARVEALRDIVADAVKAKLDETLRGRTPSGTAGTITSGDKTVADVFSAALRG